MLTFKVTGLESLEKDYEKQLKHIDDAIPAALNVVGSEMKALLAQYVKEDVYNAYKPKKYKRTGEMGDQNNMAVTVDRSSKTLTFDYHFDTKSAKPYFEDSDDVIAAVQDSKYLWNVDKRDIPERPFWDNFYNDLFNDDKVDDYFTAGLNSFDKSFNATPIEGSVAVTSEDINSLAYHDPFAGGNAHIVTDDEDEDEEN